VLLCMLILLNAFPDVIHRGLAPRLDPSMWAVLMKVSLAIVDDLLQVRLDWVLACDTTVVSPPLIICYVLTLLYLSHRDLPWDSHWAIH